MATNKINPKVLATSLTIIAFIWDVVGYIWHGLFQQPSVMNVIYPGFWSNPTLLLYGLIGTLILTYASGYVFALIYNCAGKKVR